jgi:hypothetical protein
VAPQRILYAEPIPVPCSGCGKPLLAGQIWAALRGDDGTIAWQVPWEAFRPPHPDARHTEDGGPEDDHEEDCATLAAHQGRFPLSRRFSFPSRRLHVEERARAARQSEYFNKSYRKSAVPKREHDRVIRCGNVELFILPFHRR